MNKKYLIEKINENIGFQEKLLLIKELYTQEKDCQLEVDFINNVIIKNDEKIGNWIIQNVKENLKNDKFYTFLSFPEIDNILEDHKQDKKWPRYWIGNRFNINDNFDLNAVIEEALKNKGVKEYKTSERLAFFIQNFYFNIFSAEEIWEKAKIFKTYYDFIKDLALKEKKLSEEINASKKSEVILNV